MLTMIREKKHENKFEGNLNILNVCLEIIESKVLSSHIGFCRWYSYQEVESGMFSDVEESHQGTRCVFMHLYLRMTIFLFLYQLCQVIMVKIDRDRN